MTIIPFPRKQSGCCCKAPQWLDLPAAPKAAARTRFCGDEKLPQALSPQGSLNRIADALERGQRITGLDINGPGDPMASLPLTCDLLTLLHDNHPELSVGLTTLGFGLADNTTRLVDHGIARITLLADTASSLTAEKLYAWIRPGRKNIPVSKGAKLLIDEQTLGMTTCKAADIGVIIQTTVYPGINDQEIEEIARNFAQLGAESMTLRPGVIWHDSDEKPAQPDANTMEYLAKKAAHHIAVVHVQMIHDKADIIPLTGTESMPVPKPNTTRPNVAVLSSNGMDIDLHLGQAIKALIYGPREDGLPCLLGARDLPEPGSGDRRWVKVSETLDDCFTLLTSGAGQKPRDILDRQGLPILLVEDNVEGTVDALYGGGKKGKSRR